MRLLLCLLGLLAVACGPVPEATPTPVPPVTWEGTGTSDTARAGLPAGDYVIRWQTRPIAAGCPLVGFLIRAGDATHAIQFGGTPDGAMRVNSLDAGRYYATVAAGECGWTVAVEVAH